MRPTSSVLLKARIRAIVHDARWESVVGKVLCFQVVSEERQDEQCSYQYVLSEQVEWIDERHDELLSEWCV